MPNHETKQCPRCEGGFECKSGSVLLCQCSNIELTTEQLEYINTQYSDCLCIACLHDLRSEFNTLSYTKNIQNRLLGRV